jgi:outer membrane protein TolC
MRDKAGVLRRFGAAALLVLAADGAARAAQKPLTWEQCAAVALEANPDLASSRFSLESTRASFYQSFNGVMPQIGLTNSLSEGRTMPVNRWSAQATATMNLLNASQIESIRAASASVSAAEAALRKASADLRSSLRLAFSHLLFAQSSVDVARTIEKLRERDAEMIELRYNSGTESKGNMMRTKAQALQARLSVVAAQRDVDAARRELSQRLGREEYDEFVASGTFGAAPPPPHPADLGALLPLRPEVLIAEAAERQARVSVLQAESSVLPSLSGSYARSTAGHTEFPTGNPSWTAGLTLSYPLFGNGPTSTWYGTKAARRSLDAAGRNLESARVSGQTALESAWASYADAVDQVEIQQALLLSARQRNDEADIQYASGLLSFNNWEVIVSDRVSNESQILSSLKSAMDAETAWNRALGRALGE